MIGKGYRTKGGRVRERLPWKWRRQVCLERPLLRGSSRGGLNDALKNEKFR